MTSNLLQGSASERNSFPQTQLLYQPWDIQSMYTNMCCTPHSDTCGSRSNKNDLHLLSSSCKDSDFHIMTCLQFAPPHLAHISSCESTSPAENLQLWNACVSSICRKNNLNFTFSDFYIFFQTNCWIIVELCKIKKNLFSCKYKTQTNKVTTD